MSHSDAMTALDIEAHCDLMLESHTWNNHNNPYVRLPYARLTYTYLTADGNGKKFGTLHAQDESTFLTMMGELCVLKPDSDKLHILQVRPSARDSAIPLVFDFDFSVERDSSTSDFSPLIGDEDIKSLTALMATCLQSCVNKQVLIRER